MTADDVLTTRVRLAAPAARVHRALTDPAELTAWFAEHAEVDLPRTYTFWGPGVPDGDAPHQTLRHVDDHTVRFEWRLEDTDTTVEWALAPDGPDATVVTLSQTHFPGWEAAMAGTGPLAVMHTFWALASANLSDHLDGRSLTARADFTSPVMHAQVDVGADPDTVFRSLTEPEQFARWFGANVGIEPRVGGRWSMGGFEINPQGAEITEFAPGRSMAIDFGGMVSRFELEGSAGRTRLTLVQSGFDPANPPYGSWLGWLSGLAELRRYHELPDWRTIWIAVDTPGLPEGMLSM
jgi:uncharacterized protein YndB with AHSA1/START domain